jgi:hypothetical protein
MWLLSLAVTVDEVQEHISMMLEKVYIPILVTGNVYKNVCANCLGQMLRF